MHIDPALQAMIDQTVQQGPSASSQTYLGDDSTAPDQMVESKGHARLFRRALSAALNFLVFFRSLIFE